MDEVIELAKKYRKVYEKNYKKLKIPFFDTFPVNCCEGASYFFGYAILFLFPENTVEIIKGERKHKGNTEYHFWIEVDEYIFDLTADQFDGVDFPILGDLNSDFHNTFEFYERFFVSCYLFDYTNNCIEEERFFKVQKQLTRLVMKL